MTSPEINVRKTVSRSEPASRRQSLTKETTNVNIAPKITQDTFAFLKEPVAVTQDWNFGLPLIRSIASYDYTSDKYLPAIISLDPDHSSKEYMKQLHEKLEKLHTIDDIVLEKDSCNHDIVESALESLNEAAASIEKEDLIIIALETIRNISKRSYKCQNELSKSNTIYINLMKILKFYHLNELILKKCLITLIDFVSTSNLIKTKLGALNLCSRLVKILHDYYQNNPLIIELSLKLLLNLANTIETTNNNEVTNHKLSQTSPNSRSNSPSHVQSLFNQNKPTKEVNSIAHLLPTLTSNRIQQQHLSPTQSHGTISLHSRSNSRSSSLDHEDDVHEHDHDHSTIPVIPAIIMPTAAAPMLNTRARQNSLTLTDSSLLFLNKRDNVPNNNHTTNMITETSQNLVENKESIPQETNNKLFVKAGGAKIIVEGLLHYIEQLTLINNNMNDNKLNDYYILIIISYFKSINSLVSSINIIKIFNKLNLPKICYNILQTGQDAKIVNNCLYSILHLCSDNRSGSSIIFSDIKDFYLLLVLILSKTWKLLPTLKITLINNNDDTSYLKLNSKSRSNANSRSNSISNLQISTEIDSNPVSIKIVTQNLSQHSIEELKIYEEIIEYIIWILLIHVNLSHDYADILLKCQNGTLVLILQSFMKSKLCDESKHLGNAKFKATQLLHILENRMKQSDS